MAGTNGKGSTCAMIASILKEAGLRVGLFVSPHITDFRERIQINGEKISEEDLAAGVEAIMGIIDRVVRSGCEHPTEFEIVTALAFKYFADKNCDIAVLEVGMGGGFDATNIIPVPEVAVITTISFDHMEFLGSTLTAIATEKCGIIKQGCSVVTCFGQLEEPLAVIEKTAADSGASLSLPDDSQLVYFDSGLEGSRISYKGIKLNIPLIGAHQIVNALTSVETVVALRERGYNITERNISSGIENTKWNGRMEIIRKEPLALVDAAHNADGVFVLCAALDSLFTGRRIICIMGMLIDKDYQHCIPQMARRCSTFIAVPTVGKRGLTANRVARIASMYCKSVYSCLSIDEAVKQALEIARVDDVIVACGSFMVIGEATTAFRGNI